MKATIFIIIGIPVAALVWVIAARIIKDLLSK